MSESINPIPPIPHNGKAIYRFRPALSAESKMEQDIQDEYVVVDVLNANSGLITYARNDGDPRGWVANPYERPVIRSLLDRLSKIETAVNAMADALDAQRTACQMGGQIADAMLAEYVVRLALIKLVTGRECQ